MCSLSYVHVYRIEYVSYRQGPYRIRIVSAADRIVPALVYTDKRYIQLQLHLYTAKSQYLLHRAGGSPEH